MKKGINRIRQFFNKDIWTSPVGEYSRLQSFWVHQLKIILLATQKFDQKHRRLQAASLTYYTLLSIVPTFTLLYGLMKGFGLEETLEIELTKRLSTHLTTIQTTFDLAESYVTNLQGGIFAGIGFVILLWAVFRGLRTVEDAFNDIWGVKKTKAVLHQLSDYLAIFFICPLLLVFSGSLTVVVTTKVTEFPPVLLQHLHPILPLIYVLLHLLPFVVIWATFTFLYIFMPNTKVNLSAGLWGGFVAGAIYQIIQWGYIVFQVWITKSNAIYGSLAAFPLFLVWLQVSWMTILFGAEFAFAKQNFKTYAYEPENIKASLSTKKLAAVLITHACVKAFHKGDKPLTISQMAERLFLPIRLSEEIAFDLVHAGVLSKVELEDGKTLAYQPARTLEQITVQSVLDALDHLGQEGIPFRDSPEIKKVRHHLEHMTEKIRRLPENILLKDL